MEALHEEVHDKDPKIIVLLGKTGNGKSATDVGLHVKVPKNIVLLGKTGNGKSATGNTLLQRNVFEESNYQNSCTKLLTQHSSDNLIVYDTRGPFDEGTPFYESCLNASEELKKTMENCLTVFAFVLVLNAQTRFTKEERETVDLYKNILGQDFMKKNGVMVLTHGETCDFRGNFKGWCDQQTGYFKDLIKECNNRVVLFYNKGDSTQKSRCRIELFEKMLTINSGYTIANFDENYVIRDCYIAKLNVKKFKSDTKDKIGKLKLTLNKLENSKERSPLDIQVLLAEIIKEKTTLNNVKTNDEPLTKESRHLEELYQKAEKLKPSKCVIQ